MRPFAAGDELPPEIGALTLRRARIARHTEDFIHLQWFRLAFYLGCIFRLNRPRGRATEADGAEETFTETQPSVKTRAVSFPLSAFGHINAIARGPGAYIYSRENDGNRHHVH
jgi:hypothetical protein